MGQYYLVTFKTIWSLFLNIILHYLRRYLGQGKMTSCRARVKLPPTWLGQGMLYWLGKDQFIRVAKTSTAIIHLYFPRDLEMDVFVFNLTLIIPGTIGNRIIIEQRVSALIRLLFNQRRRWENGWSWASTERLQVFKHFCSKLKLLVSESIAS